jgi:hypothetical protein
MSLVFSSSRIRRILRNLKHAPLPAYRPFASNRAELKSVVKSDWENHVRPKLPFLARTLAIGRAKWVKVHVNEWMDHSSKGYLTFSSHAESAAE